MSPLVLFHPLYRNAYLFLAGGAAGVFAALLHYPLARMLGAMGLSSLPPSIGLWALLGAFVSGTALYISAASATRDPGRAARSALAVAGINMVAYALCMGLAELLFAAGRAGTADGGNEELVRFAVFTLLGPLIALTSVLSVRSLVQRSSGDRWSMLVWIGAILGAVLGFAVNLLFRFGGLGTAKMLVVALSGGFLALIFTWVVDKFKAVRLRVASGSREHVVTSVEPGTNWIGSGSGHRLCLRLPADEGVDPAHVLIQRDDDTIRLQNKGSVALQHQRRSPGTFSKVLPGQQIVLADGDMFTVGEVDVAVEIDMKVQNR